KRDRGHDATALSLHCVHKPGLPSCDGPRHGTHAARTIGHSPGQLLPPLTHWLQTTSFCSDESYQAVLAEIHAARNVPYGAQPAPRTNPRQTGGVLGRDPTFHRGALSDRASAGRSNCCVLSTTYSRAT